jgi:hypothetical protein
MMYMLVGALAVSIFCACLAYICSGVKPIKPKRGTALSKKELQQQEKADNLHPKWQARLKLISLLPKRLVGASTMFRILLAYCQCMAVLLTLNNVAWPGYFVTFVRFLEVATIEIFALVPVECTAKTRCAQREAG